MPRPYPLRPTHLISHIPTARTFVPGHRKIDTRFLLYFAVTLFTSLLQRCLVSRPLPLRLLPGTGRGFRFVSSHRRQRDDRVFLELLHLLQKADRLELAFAHVLHFPLEPAALVVLALDPPLVVGVRARPRRCLALASRPRRRLAVALDLRGVLADADGLLLLLLLEIGLAALALLAGGLDLANNNNNAFVKILSP